MHTAVPAGEQRPDVLYIAGLWIIGFHIVVGQVVDTMRLLGVQSGLPAALFYTVFVSTTLCFAGSVVLRDDVSTLRVDLMERVLVAAMLVSIPSTVAFGGDTTDIGGNLLRLVLTYTCYKASRAYILSNGLKRALPVLAWCGLIGVVLATMLVYALGVFAGLPVYLGVNSEWAFLALACLLVTPSRYRMLGIVFVVALVIAGGKRGPMLAMALILVAYVWLSLRMGGVRRRALTNFAISGSLVLMAVGGALAWIGPDRVWEALPYNLRMRFATLGIGGERAFDPELATSGRSSEVVLVADAWRLSPVGLWTGFGLGASIENDIGERLSTIHISPVALVFIFGLPVGALLFLTPILWSLQPFRQRRPQLTRAEQAWWLIVVGMLGASLSVFTILQTPVLWMGLGALRARHVQNLAASRRSARLDRARAAEAET